MDQASRIIVRTVPRGCRDFHINPLLWDNIPMGCFRVSQMLLGVVNALETQDERYFYDL